MAALIRVRKAPRFDAEHEALNSLMKNSKIKNGSVMAL